MCLILDFLDTKKTVPSSPLPNPISLPFSTSFPYTCSSFWIQSFLSSDGTTPWAAEASHLWFSHSSHCNKSHHSKAPTECQACAYWVEYPLCVRNCAYMVKHPLVCRALCILNSHSICLRWELWPFPIDWWEFWGTEMWGNWPMITQVRRQNQEANPGMTDSERRLLPSVHYCFGKLVNSQCHCHASSWVIVGVGDSGNHYPACLSAFSILSTFMLPVEWDFLAHISCRIGSILPLQALHCLTFADFPYSSPMHHFQCHRELTVTQICSQCLPIARADPLPRMPFPTSAIFATQLKHHPQWKSSPLMAPSSLPSFSAHISHVAPLLHQNLPTSTTYWLLFDSRERFTSHLCIPTPTCPRWHTVSIH